MTTPTALAGSPPAWCESWIGMEFEFGGRGPETCDCWGLVRGVLIAQHGVGAPEYAGAHLDDLHDRLARGTADESPWVEVGGPDYVAQAGDVLAFSLGGLHVGIVVSRDHMLHHRQSTLSRLDRWRREPWATSLVAVFRHGDLVVQPEQVEPAPKKRRRRRKRG